jgi:hypothetical protein
MVFRVVWPALKGAVPELVVLVRSSDSHASWLSCNQSAGEEIFSVLRQNLLNGRGLPMG